MGDDLEREKDFERIHVGDKVKVLPPPHLNPGVNLSSEAVYGRVISKNPRKRTIKVKLKIYEDEEDKKEIEKEIDPSVDDVYKGGKRRNRKTRRRRHPRRK